MYAVVITERYEDWYVADATIGEFNTLEEAIHIFHEECRNIQAQKYSTSGIDNCISESFEDIDEFIEGYSGGFVASICRTSEMIASQYFEYDYRSRSINAGSGVELH